jgi:hypothetical protein
MTTENEATDNKQQANALPTTVNNIKETAIRAFPFNCLPDEVKIEILKFLPSNDFRHALQTSSNNHQLFKKSYGFWGTKYLYYYLFDAHRNMTSVNLSLIDDISSQWNIYEPGIILLASFLATEARKSQKTTSTYAFQPKVWQMEFELKKEDNNKETENTEEIDLDQIITRIKNKKWRNDGGMGPPPITDLYSLVSSCKATITTAKKKKIVDTVISAANAENDANDLRQKAIKIFPKCLALGISTQMTKNLIEQLSKIISNKEDNGYVRIEAVKALSPFIASCTNAETLKKLALIINFKKNKQYLWDPSLLALPAFIDSCVEETTIASWLNEIIEGIKKAPLAAFKNKLLLTLPLFARYYRKNIEKVKIISDVIIAHTQAKNASVQENALNAFFRVLDGCPNSMMTKTNLDRTLTATKNQNEMVRRPAFSILPAFIDFYKKIKIDDTLKALTQGIKNESKDTGDEIACINAIKSLPPFINRCKNIETITDSLNAIIAAIIFYSDDAIVCAAAFSFGEIKNKNSNIIFNFLKAFTGFLSNAKAHTEDYGVIMSAVWKISGYIRFVKKPRQEIIGQLLAFGVIEETGTINNKTDPTVVEKIGGIMNNKKLPQKKKKALIKSTVASYFVYTLFAHDGKLERAPNYEERCDRMFPGLEKY